MCLVKLILVLVLICWVTKEGYQNNRPPQDRPDETQFIACHDYSSSENLGNTNYKLHTHRLGKPLKGTYSSFLDIYGIRNYDEFFHSPICEEEYNFESIDNLEFREIPDSLDEDIDQVYGEEISIDDDRTKDPNYVYVNPQYIGNTLLYPDEINQAFLRSHRSHDDENLLYRIQRGIYN